MFLFGRIFIRPELTDSKTAILADRVLLPALAFSLLFRFQGAITLRYSN
jgi:hypothetical protein